jgi:hypothetical protein
MRVALLPVAALATACYRPTVPSGAPCETSADCPSSQDCIEGMCGGRLETGEPDALPPGAVVFVAGEDRSQVRDTEIASYSREENFNDQDHVSVDTPETTLIWFDLAGAPPGLTLVRATLQITTTDDASEDGGTVLVHRLLEKWDEATVTWNQRMAGMAWMMPGALPPSREQASIAELRPNKERTRFDVELPVELVRGWLADPATNLGLAIVRGTSSQHVHFGVREATRWSRLLLELRP